MIVKNELKYNFKFFLLHIAFFAFLFALIITIQTFMNNLQKTYNEDLKNNDYTSIIDVKKLSEEDAKGLINEGCEVTYYYGSVYNEELTMFIPVYGIPDLDTNEGVIKEYDIESKPYFNETTEEGLRIEFIRSNRIINSSKNGIYVSFLGIRSNAEVKNIGKNIDEDIRITKHYEINDMTGQYERYKTISDVRKGSSVIAIISSSLASIFFLLMFISLIKRRQNFIGVLRCNGYSLLKAFYPYVLQTEIYLIASLSIGFIISLISSKQLSLAIETIMHYKCDSYPSFLSLLTVFLTCNISILLLIVCYYLWSRKKNSVWEVRED